MWITLANVSHFCLRIYQFQPPAAVPDIDDIEQLSLEGVKIKAEYDKKINIAHERKSKVLATLASHRNTLRKLFKR